jgi:hypothetical protein
VLTDNGAERKAGVLAFALPAGLDGPGPVRLWFEYGESGYSVADLGVWPAGPLAESAAAPPAAGQVGPARPRADWPRVRLISSSVYIYIYIYIYIYYII